MSLAARNDRDPATRLPPHTRAEDLQVPAPAEGTASLHQSRPSRSQVSATCWSRRVSIKTVCSGSLGSVFHQMNVHVYGNNWVSKEIVYIYIKTQMQITIYMYSHVFDRTDEINIQRKVGNKHHMYMYHHCEL